VRQPGVWYLLGGSLIVLFAGILATILLPALDYAAPTARAQAFAPDSAEARGKQIYQREGCGYCHTQQVRAPEADKANVHRPGDIGPESLAGDYAFQSPVLWGTNRNGPDLSHVASRGLAGTLVWQIQHLKAPRAFAGESTMPSYAYLPDRELRDLAAYLVTLR
jgi:cbb3-type cytochrome c oxidase subunit II